MDEAKLEVMRNIAIAHCSSNADQCIQINGSLCTMHSLQSKCTCDLFGYPLGLNL